MRGAALVLVAAVLAVSPASASRRRASPWLEAAPTSWRAAATEEDRQRLRDWRTIWVAAAAQARAGGGAGAIAADPALFDPDAGRDGQVGPGDYRCRRAALGGGGATVGPWGECRIAGAGAALAFTGAAAPPQAVGRIYPDGPRRSVFLGSVCFAQERRAPRHGQAAGRDLAGLVERIDDARWRIAMPNAPFGEPLQLIELTR